MEAAPSFETLCNLDHRYWQEHIVAIFWRGRPYETLQHIVTRRGGGVRVTYKTGFGLVDWIYWHLIHSTRNYRQQSYRYATHFTVHRYTRTRVLSLH
jgi:hypothetical protein